MMPRSMNPSHSLTLIKPASDIGRAIRELAARLVADDVVAGFEAVVLMDGASRFFTALRKELMKTHSTSFQTVSEVRLQSYRDTRSLGCVTGLEGLDACGSSGRIVVIDDILDSGCTLEKTLERLHAVAGRDIRSCVLFCKDRPDLPDRLRATYSGMDVPDDFVVGYGLDYNGLYRDLDGLYVLNT